MSETGKVILDFKVFKDIVEQTRPYGTISTPRDEWREVYGFLFGIIDEKTNDLVIFAQEIITIGGETDVEFKDEDYLRAAELESQYFEKGGFCAGWWHTHPGHGVFLSGADKLNQLQQSANPRYIALVFDCTKVTPDYPGIEVMRLQNPGIGLESDVVKVPWEFRKPDWKYVKKLSQELDPHIPLTEREQAREQVLQDQGSAEAHLAQKDAKGDVLLKRAEQLAEMKDYEQSNATLFEILPNLQNAQEADLYFDALVLMGNNLVALGRDEEVAQLGVQIKTAAEERGVSNYYLPGMAEYFIGRGLFAQGAEFHAEAFDHLKEAARMLGTENYYLGVGRVQDFMGTVAMKTLKKPVEAVAWWVRAKKSYLQSRTTDSAYNKYYETENYVAGLVQEVDAHVAENLRKLSPAQISEVRKLKEQLGVE
jgi:proteasome lid subunit RPN8/RPN11/tetratricopeptide (TPR) repeat protein